MPQGWSRCSEDREWGQAGRLALSPSALRVYPKELKSQGASPRRRLGCMEWGVHSAPNPRAQPNSWYSACRLCTPPQLGDHHPMALGLRPACGCGGGWVRVYPRL